MPKSPKLDSPQQTKAVKSRSPKRSVAKSAVSMIPQIDEPFRRLVEAVQDYAIFILDPQGFISTWNPGAEAIKGYQPDEIIGKHFSIFYPAEDLEWDKPVYELKVASETGRFEDEGWRVRKDGTRFWANVIITALKDKDGTLRGFGKVTRDLTERKHAEEVLRQSEERFRLLVESVSDYAIFMLDPQGYIARHTARSEAINPYTSDEIIQKHISILYPTEDIERDKPKFELTVAEED